MQGGDEWNKYVVDEEVYREDMEKSFAKLCEEIYYLVLDIKNEVYEEEEHCNFLSLEDPEVFEKDCRTLHFAYGIYEIAEKIKYKVKALCRKIYLGQGGIHKEEG
jgi:hypothetical protein